MKETRKKLPSNRSETDEKQEILEIRKGKASNLVHKRPSNNSSIWIFI
jgi:hypothetical protein